MPCSQVGESGDGVCGRASHSNICNLVFQGWAWAINWYHRDLRMVVATLVHQVEGPSEDFDI